MVTGGHGVRMQYNYTHDTAGLQGAISATSARWLRLTRSGETITGYDSADGTHWTKVGTASFVIGSVTFTAGLAAAAVAVPLVGRTLRDNGEFMYPVSSLTELRVIAGTAALLAVAAVLAVAAGAVLRRSAGAITAVIAAIVLPYILATASVLPTGPSQWLLRVTPAAAFAIQQSIPQYFQVSNAYQPSRGYYPLAPWAGFAVLCAWAAVTLALAIVLLRRRDA